MKNDKIRAELIRILEADDLKVKHPTVASFGTRFVDYTEYGALTLEYPIRDWQCNGWHLLNGGVISTFIDNNYGLFVFVAIEGRSASTINMQVSFHKSAIFDDGYVRVTSRVVAAGKRIISMAAEAFNPKGELIASSSTNFINAEGAFLEV
jgi:uncharacterized protein (TIGR00369 family)